MSVLQEYDFFVDNVPIVIRITDDAYVDANEEYLTDGTAFSVSGLARVTYSYSNRDDEVHETNSIYLQNATIWEYYPRRAGYLSYDGSKYNIVGSLRTGNRNVGFSINGSANLLSWYAPSGSNLTRVAYDFCTNIPIFDSQENAITYVTTTNKNTAISLLEEHCINYKSGVNFDDTTKEYYVYNRYENVNIERGIVTNIDSVVHQLNERILFNGDKICFYRTSSNPFILKLKWNGDVVGSYFSNSQSIDDIPYSLFTNEIQYDTPFYTTYDRTFEIYDYNGNIAIGLSTNIPIWNNEQNADAYLAGNLSVTQSENWDKISNDSAYKDYINNRTGEEETVTQMGQSYAQNFFSQLYLCATSGVNQIASALYDVGGGSPTITGLWDEIKEGIEMYGDDPMQSVQGLMFFPLDLSSIFTNVSDQTYVYFGGYKLDLTTTVKKVIFPNGYKSLGTINIVRTFKDWRDFEPYTKLFIYLPYAGTFQLQLSRYYGKSTEIRYYFDLRTGSCLVALLTDGLLTDYFNGQCGMQTPITLTDKSNYANSQINTLLKGAGSIGSVIKDVSNGIGAGLSVPVTSAFGALQAGISVSKTVYDLTQNNKGDFNKTTGGSTSMLNEFLPQYAYFIFEIQQTLDSENVQSLIGLPSNKSGSVGEFSGYLEVETVNLKCGIATDNEKRRIENMLRTGVII